MIVLSNLGKTSTLGEMKTRKFKPSELGHIPAEWEVKSLGELWDDFRTGPFGSALHAQDYVTGGTPLINPMHIQDGRICPTSDMSVDKVTEQRLSIYRLSKDDIIIGRRGEMGRAALVGEEEAGWLCGTGCFFLRMKDVMSPDFVTRYLRTSTCISVLEGEAVGTTLVNLNQTILGRVNVPVPPLPEQRKIAAALSDVDEMIAALEKLIEKKRKIKTGAMQRLLAGNTRLPGFKGVWVEKRLGDCGEWIGGGTPSTQNAEYWNGHIPWISSSDLEEGNVYHINKTRFISESAVRNSATSKCPQGALLIIARVGVGKVAIADKELCTSQDFSNLVVEDKTDVRFLAYLLSVVMARMKEATQGTSIKGVSLEDMKALALILPPTLAEQKAIAKVLGDMDDEIAALEAELAKTRQLKQGMMQELLTGRVRLG